MAEPTKLSQTAHDRLQAEHKELTGTGRIDIARKIETARELGDLSENGDYHAAKEHKGKMEGRIMHLESLLEDAIIVDGADTDQVSEGCVVSILYEGDTHPEQFLIGSIEERREGVDVMSPGSPLGAALLGAKPGETVGFQTPTGMTLSVKVVAISE